MSTLFKSMPKFSLQMVRHRRRLLGNRLNKWDSSISRVPNPGIQQQLELLEPKKDETDVEQSDIDDAEMDFMEANKMHVMHESEQEVLRHVQQLKMVGHKYFRGQHGPNMLTWAEKEQIRYLHSLDKEKWSVEKLARSFPATEATVEKILKASWRPRHAERVLRHDETVKKNWDLFRSGQLDVDAELKRHLSQFTKRTIPVTQVSDSASLFSDEASRPKPKTSEFGSIIESYESVKCKDSSKDDGKCTNKTRVLHEGLPPPKSDSFLLRGGQLYVRSGQVTLEKYKEKVLAAINKGYKPSEEDKMMLTNSVAAETLSGSDKTQLASVNVDLTGATEVQNQISGETYPPERIRIPKNKWKKGGTFKISDCYYDDDGTFLYRVPGMK